MSIPNIGPQHADSDDPDGAEAPRRGNSPPVLRGEVKTDDVTAASARASTVTHRFGGVRYALSRPDVEATDRKPPTEDGESDALE